MSNIDNRPPVLPFPNLALKNMNDPNDPNAAGDDAALLGESDGDNLNPFAEPGTTGKGAGKAKGGGHAQGAGATKGAAAAADVEDLGSVQQGTDPKDQSAGLIGEKKRTGMASLSEPLPMPPSALRVTNEHLTNFHSLNGEVNQALTKAQPNNQPSFDKMHQQLSQVDQSTPQGKAQAAQLNGRMTQTAVNAVRSYSGTNSLAGFMALAMGYQSKQQGIEGRLNSLTMQGREVMAKQQAMQSHEQAQALKKAQKKQDAMAFLKPLMAVVMAALTVLTMGTMTGPALALMAVAATAGFIAGGVAGGKENGGGFDIGKAFEGLASGLAAGGAAGAIMKAIMKVAEMAMSAGLKAGAQAATKGITKKMGDQLTKIGVRKSGEGSKLLSEAEKTGEKAVKTTAEKAARGDSSALGKMTDKFNKVRDDAKGFIDRNKYMPKAQSMAEIGQNVTDTVGGMQQAAVNRERAKAAQKEANAKMMKVIEDAYQQEGERTQDMLSTLNSHRKSTMDNIEGLLKNQQSAAAGAIQGIAR